MAEKEYTTIILGAGVSHNYGFPLGKELISHIKSILPEQVKFDGVSNDFTTIMNAFMKGTNARLDFIEYGRRLKQNLEVPITSIDNYINRFDESIHEKAEEYRIYKYILKSAIALRIAKCEVKINSVITTHDQNIYSYLYEKMFYRRKYSEIKNIKIINFNYDRSFDHAINRWFITEDLDPADYNIYMSHIDRTLPNGFQNRFNSLEIIHPYGTLGDIDEIAFGTKPEWHNLDKMTDNISVITNERNNTDDNFKKCRDLLSKSKTILFLGFGFDPVNIEKLGFIQNHRPPYVNPWFAAIKMLDGEIDSLIPRIMSNRVHSPKIENAAKNFKSSDLVTFLRSNHIFRE